MLTESQRKSRREYVIDTIKQVQKLLKAIPDTPEYGCGEGWPNRCSFCGIMACHDKKPLCPVRLIMIWDIDKGMTFEGEHHFTDGVLRRVR